ncbi:MAG: LamG domain-containing protein, partial [Deltaproteobacteria bacterium]|nr:LamG domain-containing protein [Deltaproteobacteria bacterium]
MKHPFLSDLSPSLSLAKERVSEGRVRSGILLCFTLLAMTLLGCGPGGGSFEGSIQSSPLQKLATQGIDLRVFAIVSTDPEERQELQKDETTGLFRGQVSVSLGSQFDLQVIYEAFSSAANQWLEVAYFYRNSLVADAEIVHVAYVGDESNWQKVFDLSPGKPNPLNLDGDPFSNYDEVVYRTDPTKASSVPDGPALSKTYKDPFSSLDVSLPPPGSGDTDAIRGDEEILLQAFTPYDLKVFEVISPTYGWEVLNPTEVLTTGKMRLLLHTEAFVIGKGTASLTVRVVDEKFTKDVTITFAVFNGTDNLPPQRAQMGLKPGQVLTGSTTFTWELDDPSGIDGNSVSVKYEGHPEVSMAVVDKDSTPNRLLADISLPLSLSNGKYQVTFSARDSSPNHNLYTETVPVEIGRSGNQNPRLLSLAVSASPKPDSFTVSWQSFDPDGDWDIAGYDADFTSNGSTIIHCTGLKQTSLKAGDDLSSCTLSRTGYGELLNPFRLAPQTDYTVVVTVRDTMGAFAQGSTSFSVGDTGLDGWWELDGDLQDRSGNNRHGGLRGDSDGNPSNNFNGGLVLDGADDYVDLGNTFSYDRMDKFTIEALVKRGSRDTGDVIFSKTRNDTGYVLLFRGAGFAGNTLQFQIADQNRVQVGAYTERVFTENPPVWHSIVMTYDGSSSGAGVKMFVDGVPEALVVDGGSLDGSMTTTEPARIGVMGGAVAGTINAPFDGTISSVAIHNRVLSEEEIRRSCRRSSLSTCPDPRSPIILLPTAGEQLPPTKALWVWRSEKDPAGRGMYPGLTYKVSYDEDLNFNGSYDRSYSLEPNFTKRSDGSWFYVLDPLDAQHGYRIRICAEGTGCTISDDADPQRGTRTFSTDSSIMGWWKMDGNQLDSSGRGHNGVPA